ncbi:MAG: hypothetical protein AB7L90_11815 [Hyphomicrobiaceae bacterium]
MNGVVRYKGDVVAALVMAFLALPILAPAALAQHGQSILYRNLDVSRERAAEQPRSEGDQAIVGGWPLYRTPRGQEAYNATMATLSATAGAAPTKHAFARCFDLDCDFDLPRIGANGWIPAGRIWISPSDYVLVVHSPRPDRASRRSRRSMRYFVFHEFHNSSRNTDTYDTISSHHGRVFVPFYLSKTGVDAHGRQYVAIVQVAPYDVVSVHATNYGSAGPGVEVAKNFTDDLQPLQARAGIVLAQIVKQASPQLRVVNHRGREGLLMLQGYEHWLAARRRDRAQRPVALPFVSAPPERIASAHGALADLIFAPSQSRRLAVAERAFVPPRVALEAPIVRDVAALSADEPRLVGGIRLARRPERWHPTPVLVRPVQLVRRSAFVTNVGQ